MILTIFLQKLVTREMNVARRVVGVMFGYFESLSNLSFTWTINDMQIVSLLKFFDV